MSTSKPITNTIMNKEMMINLQKGLKQILRFSSIKQGTKRALEAENHFLNGAIWANPELIDKYPTLPIYMMSGRSILDLES